MEFLPLSFDFAPDMFLFLFGCLSVSLSSPLSGQGIRVGGDPPDIDVLSFEAHLKVLRFLPSHPAWTEGLQGLGGTREVGQVIKSLLGQSDAIIPEILVSFHSLKDPNRMGSFAETFRYIV